LNLFDFIDPVSSSTALLEDDVYKKIISNCNESIDRLFDEDEYLLLGTRLYDNMIKISDFEL
jgi:hypothetical protein